MEHCMQALGDVRRFITKAQRMAVLERSDSGDPPKYYQVRHDRIPVRRI